ncbi:MAG: hypothetical protein VX257_06900, partial [Planctomycetota bacterium]|nr:hypothetical protein [Planctomycetota bacterium]
MTTVISDTDSDVHKTPVQPIQIYNTLSRTKEPLQPVIPGKVSIYLCGPTVYDKAHIGHMVGPVIFDTVKRYGELLAESHLQLFWSCGDLQMFRGQTAVPDIGRVEEWA